MQLPKDKYAVEPICPVYWWNCRAALDLASLFDEFEEASEALYSEVKAEMRALRKGALAGFARSAISPKEYPGLVFLELHHWIRNNWITLIDYKKVGLVANRGKTFYGENAFGLVMINPFAGVYGFNTERERYLRINEDSSLPLSGRTPEALLKLFEYRRGINQIDRHDLDYILGYMDEKAVF